MENLVEAQAETYAHAQESKLFLTQVLYFTSTLPLFCINLVEKDFEKIDS